MIYEYNANTNYEFRIGVRSGTINMLSTESWGIKDFVLSYISKIYIFLFIIKYII